MVSFSLYSFSHVCFFCTKLSIFFFSKLHVNCSFYIKVPIVIKHLQLINLQFQLICFFFTPASNLPRVFYTDRCQSIFFTASLKNSYSNHKYPGQTITRTFIIDKNRRCLRLSGIRPSDTVHDPYTSLSVMAIGEIT